MGEKTSGKPVWAILDDHAYSAAYAIASAADRIIIPRTGGIGWWALSRCIWMSPSCSRRWE